MVQPRARLRVRSNVLAAVTAVLLGTTLAACGSGVEAGTLDMTEWNGARGEAGDILVRNAVLVLPEEPDGEGVMAVTLVNQGDEDDTLLAITAAGEETTAFTLRPRSIALAAGTTSVVPTGTRPGIDVETDVAAGTYLPVTMQFERAGSVELTLRVVTAVHEYATLTPTPA